MTCPDIIILPECVLLPVPGKIFDEQRVDERDASEASPDSRGAKVPVRSVFLGSGI